MYKKRVISPKQLAMMSQIVDYYCKVHGITDEGAKEKVALQVILFFNGGFSTSAELKAALLRPDVIALA